jgi:hypothetical protein
MDSYDNNEYEQEISSKENFDIENTFEENEEESEDSIPTEIDEEFVNAYGENLYEKFINYEKETKFKDVDFSIKNEPNKKLNKNELGKKTNKNKYRFHNFLRTIKSKLLDMIKYNLNVILEKGEKKEEEENKTTFNIIKEKKIRKFLKPIDIASGAKTDDNYDIFKMKLREIFSLDISPQIKNYPIDHNKNLVKEIEEIKDEQNMVKINAILDLTFFQCLKHFISFEKQNILEKFELEKGYNKLIEKLSKDEKDFYEMKLKDFIDEKIKSRNTKKKE